MARIIASLAADPVRSNDASGAFTAIRPIGQMPDITYARITGSSGRLSVILVVDDDPTIRMVAVEILTTAGHEVVEAVDGDEALKLAAATAFDLVVLDMLMPNKDGLETIVELRRSQPQMRILAISSGGRMEAGQLLRMALVFGADETMAKPLRNDSFGQTVSGLLSKARVDPDPTSVAARLTAAASSASDRSL